jgi:hypothetical protein
MSQYRQEETSGSSTTALWQSYQQIRLVGYNFRNLFLTAFRCTKSPSTMGYVRFYGSVFTRVINAERLIVIGTGIPLSFVESLPDLCEVILISKNTNLSCIDKLICIVTPN